MIRQSLSLACNNAAMPNIYILTESVAMPNIESLSERMLFFVTRAVSMFPTDLK
jgi:hypothetical protein